MLALLTTLLPVLAGVIDKVLPDPQAAAAANLELQKALLENQSSIESSIAEAAKAQAAVNAIEAANPSKFVSGWRPACGWVCVAGLTYGLVLQPFLAWATLIVGVLVAAAIPVPPSVDLDILLTLLSGLLGLGGLRTFEKRLGIARK